MAKAGLLFVGTSDGVLLFSDPGGVGRWLRIGHEVRGQEILAVWPLFDNPQVILLGGPGGLWRSSDGGAGWSHLSEQAIAAFSGEKATPMQVQALDAQGMRLHSSDGGQTWQAPGESALLPESTYATLAGREPVELVAQGASIQRSANNGATWEETTIDQPWLGEVAVIVPARYNIDIAYAGSTGGQLATSTDRGRTWQVVKHNLAAIRSICATRLA